MSMVDHVLESICYICKHSGDFHFKCTAGKMLEQDKKSCPKFHLTSEGVWYRPQLSGCGEKRKGSPVSYLLDHEPSRPNSC